MVLRIFSALMLAGNLYGLYQLLVSKAAMQAQYNKITDTNYILLLLLPCINIIGLTGLLFDKKWAAILVIACALAVIAADIWFKINYHLYVAIPAALAMICLIYLNRNILK